jgi:chromosome segregation ATPase
MSVIFLPKSESQSVFELHNYLYENELEYSPEDHDTLVGHYENIDREMSSLEEDMVSVEEQVEIAEEQLEELKGGLKDILDNKDMKKAEILKEIERLLI